MPKAPIKMSAEEKEYRAESDLRTLIDAERIKKDKPRMEAVMKKRDQMKADLAKVEG